MFRNERKGACLAAAKLFGKLPGKERVLRYVKFEIEPKVQLLLPKKSRRKAVFYFLN